MKRPIKAIPLLTGRQQARFDRYIPDRPAAGCWAWHGPRQGNGYGWVSINYKNYLAHRVAYTRAYGPIPEGMVLDHVCRNRLCVRPDHLQPVTMGQNHTFKYQRDKQPHHMSERTQCKNGHAYIPGNYIDDSRGFRRCLICRRVPFRKSRSKSTTGE